MAAVDGRLRPFVGRRGRTDHWGLPAGRRRQRSRHQTAHTTARCAQNTLPGKQTDLMSATAPRVSDNSGLIGRPGAEPVHLMLHDSFGRGVRFSVAARADPSWRWGQVPERWASSETDLS